jgi:hypothetical protein
MRFYNFQAENDVKCACTFVLRPFETHSSIQILSPFFNTRTIVLPHATRTPVEPVASQACNKPVCLKMFHFMFTEEVATFSAVIGRDTSFSPGQTFLFTNVNVNTNNMYNPSNGIAEIPSDGNYS